MTFNCCYCYKPQLVTIQYKFIYFYLVIFSLSLIITMIIGANHRPCAVVK